MVPAGVGLVQRVLDLVHRIVVDMVETARGLILLMAGHTPCPWGPQALSVGRSSVPNERTKIKAILNIDYLHLE